MASRGGGWESLLTSYPPGGVEVREREAARGVASLFEAEISGGSASTAVVPAACAASKIARLWPPLTSF